MKLSQATEHYKTLKNKYKGYIDTWDSIYKLDTDEIDSTTGLYQEIKNNLIDTGYFTPKEMIRLIGDICKQSLHYRHGYIELMKRISEGYQCSDIYNISFLSQYDDIKINTPEYAIMNDNEDELLYHLKSKRLNLTEILEKCCLRGAVNCFKLLQKEFDVEITKACLDASFIGNNRYIINECLKENVPDMKTTRAAIASHNFGNLYMLLNEYNAAIKLKDCYKYKNLHAFIYLLDKYEVFNTMFLLSPSFHIPSLYEYMIQNGADINYVDEYGVTCLFLQWLKIKQILH
ncbi:hypothetical protein TVAG_256130 [Trichomonas vaginalis G3]|uniref:DUF3447 domain-containing protein n=1 Tax=Trichomonas vaginalis (strain ATCC PRA-98 / G3) TaxID=412133 RepID=A2FYA7_TRIV3|nr:protein ubiquitination [Trichomonas vaginalis G3]EAX90108.1 hypothetical protein TVAG_256130 [Trichomonas vaginalis G3]KAI5521661.1 protein ubiquitination [Trichomonas vaginalis G3]|eukprot:XP_001303038.1 hypothetical protein [Trichomonas vaginalis G3]